MSRLWTNDEELAKKDDDLTDPRLARHNHGHGHGHGHGHQWQGAGRVPRRRSIARFAAYAVVAFLIIFGLTKALGGSSSSSSGAHFGLDRTRPNRFSHDGLPGYEAADRPPDEGTSTIGGEKGSSSSSGGGGSSGTGSSNGQSEPAKTYGGPLKLPALGQSLHAIGSTGGKQAKNRNVLFAAGSLRSAATLLPFACQMAFEHRNYVHFVLMGRSEISLLELLKINGIDTSCPLILHGAVHSHTFHDPFFFLGGSW